MEGGQRQCRKRWASSASLHVSSFLHTYLSVCLCPFLLPSPSPPRLMKQAKLGPPSRSTPNPSTPPLHSESLREAIRSPAPDLKPWLALIVPLVCSAPCTVRRRWPHSCSPGRGRNSGTEAGVSGEGEGKCQPGRPRSLNHHHPARLSWPI